MNTNTVKKLALVPAVLAAVALTAACEGTVTVDATGPGGDGPAGATTQGNPGADPAWVVTSYLDNRLDGKAVPDYPYVCAEDAPWTPAGLDNGSPPPFAAEQDRFLDIQSYNRASVEVHVARDPRYRAVTLSVRGYERQEERTFLLGPQGGGFCIGELV